MKINRFALFAALTFLMTSCFKGELLNSEADILECILPSDILKSEPKLTNTDVMILVYPDKADITRLAPEFEITEGALISPASGTELDFSEPQSYVVTSQDGNWKKVYTVRVSDSEMPTRYQFEHWAPYARYENPYELSRTPMGLEQRHDIWSSGNAGFAMTGGGSSPEKYPTGSTTEARSGNLAAKLVTRATGTFGSALGMPIAAGNLFIGTFDGDNATKAPLKATHFGLSFGERPVVFKGYYRYISGGNVTDNKGNIVVPARRDACRIYAVLYKTDDQTPYLDGSNILTSDNIVASAILADPRESDGYIPFAVDFEYIKPFDPQTAAMYGYNLAVVFSSSIRGDRFEGAVGSTLYVDDVEVVTGEN